MSEIWLWSLERENGGRESVGREVKEDRGKGKSHRNQKL